MEQIALNGRFYRRPARPTVVICADGCDPAYLDAGIAAGVLPTIAGFREHGFFGFADAAMPTFTNPNNISIVTGAPPSVHGIAGNFMLDRETGAEIMMTDPALLRSPTLLALMSEAGVATAAVTAKDKLRRMLGHGWTGICFSSEMADSCTLAEHGIDEVETLVGRPKPDMYSADLSLFVLDAGIRLVELGRAELLYLSLSDYVQHRHAPEELEALDFHRALDERIAALIGLGCVVGVTADHGMNDKALPDGGPHVIFLEDVLNRQFGAGAVRVICPITDPFVRHHGALGSFVRVYARNGVAPAELARAVRGLPGVDQVLNRAAAAAEYELPYDREADLVVTGDRNTVLGASEAEHDLSALAGHRLRSHGGRGEQRVPFLLSHSLNARYREKATARLRNFDIFDFALNGVAP
ncbi:MAG TPA: phosphonoacetate hydrolase [Stellaceae bacterium]|jgi:phosphonoacetate hydrolase|nr:phosphonoacetate hydrolase [Stellaceae bacterium]